MSSSSIYTMYVCIYGVNRLHGLQSHRAARRPAMTAFQCQACLRWCQQQVNWNLNMWRNTMFSDESRFCVHHLDCKVHEENAFLIAAPLE